MWYDEADTAIKPPLCWHTERRKCIVRGMTGYTWIAISTLTAGVSQYLDMWMVWLVGTTISAKVCAQVE